MPAFSPYHDECASLCRGAGSRGTMTQEHEREPLSSCMHFVTTCVRGRVCRRGAGAHCRLSTILLFFMRTSRTSPTTLYPACLCNLKPHPEVSMGNTGVNCVAASQAVCSRRHNGGNAVSSVVVTYPCSWPRQFLFIAIITKRSLLIEELPCYVYFGPRYQLAGPAGSSTDLPRRRPNVDERSAKNRKKDAHSRAL